MTFLKRTLRIDSIHHLERYDGDIPISVRAELPIIKGALQTMASRILSQTSRERAGEVEMHRGIDRLCEVKKEPPVTITTGSPKSIAEIVRALRLEGKLK